MKRCPYRVVEEGLRWRYLSGRMKRASSGQFAGQDRQGHDVVYVVFPAPTKGTVVGHWEERIPGTRVGFGEWTKGSWTTDDEPTPLRASLSATAFTIWLPSGKKVILRHSGDVTPANFDARGLAHHWLDRIGDRHRIRLTTWVPGASLPRSET